MEKKDAKKVLVLLSALLLTALIEVCCVIDVMVNGVDVNIEYVTNE